MPVVPLAVIMLGVGTVSVVVDRRLQARRQRAETMSETVGSSAEAAADMATGFVSNVWATTTGWTSRLWRRTPADLPQASRAWVVEAASDDEEVVAWINGLSDDGLQSFTKHVGAFCSDMEFELSWLVGGQFDKNPELLQATEHVVIHYCRSCQQAATAQDDIEVFKHLLAFERNPASRKSRDFGEKVYAKVVEAGLVTATVSEYLATPRREQPQRLVRTIRAAADNDTTTFNQLLREVVRGEAASKAGASAPKGGASS